MLRKVVTASHRLVSSSSLSAQPSGISPAWAAARSTMRWPLSLSTVKGCQCRASTRASFVPSAVWPTVTSTHTKVPVPASALPSSGDWLEMKLPAEYDTHMPAPSGPPSRSSLVCGTCGCALNRTSIWPVSAMARAYSVCSATGSEVYSSPIWECRTTMSAPASRAARACPATHSTSLRLTAHCGSAVKPLSP